MTKALVTGGAGFIGSHLVDRLITNHEIIVLDNLSTGVKDNIAAHAEAPNFQFLKGSITSGADIKRAMEDVDIIYHFAAQPDVRVSTDRPLWDFDINVRGSLKILECARKRNVSKIVFASSGGTVYGTPEVLPTPESQPLRPISNYAAAKSAVEMYLSSYAELYGIDSVSLRLANIFGPRLTHGVIFDFYSKLKKNPTRLEVLGDGKQEKSYMYVSDAVEATLILARNITPGHTPVNIGSGERLRVSRIAELVIEGLQAYNAEIHYSGSERGWEGDVTITDLDFKLLKELGWKLKVPLERGVKLYIQWLIDRFGSLS
ncbi:MAG: NAD-dependent epimerase/dehydratase family protein [Candidatus Thorarchaeota archaeon]